MSLYKMQSAEIQNSNCCLTFMLKNDFFLDANLSKIVIAATPFFLI